MRSLFPLQTTACCDKKAGGDEMVSSVNYRAVVRSLAFMSEFESWLYHFLAV